MKYDSKRQNFNVSPDQEAQLDALRENLDAPSIKDAVLRAAQITNMLVREARAGYQLYVKSSTGETKQVLIPELAASQDWIYLTRRDHPWRKQLYVKGRRLMASTVWSDMYANNMTVEEVADNWDLPVEAVREIIRYCEANEDLLRVEAEEERARLIAMGVKVAD